MKFPSYVNPMALLSEEALDRVVKELSSTVSRGKIWSHFAATRAVLGEMADVETKIREDVADWLSEQGDFYTEAAQAIREGKKPSLAPKVNFRAESEEVLNLRAELERVKGQRDYLQLELSALKAAALAPDPVLTSDPVEAAHELTGGKPWAVARKDGSREYFDSRSQARAAAQSGDRVLDLR